MQRLPAPARYFPVQAGPRPLRAGLRPFGADFGNGTRDTQYFQIDRERERYRDVKERVLAERCGTRESSHGETRAHDTVVDWFERRMRAEGLQCAPAASRARNAHYLAVALTLQEDFAILHRAPDGADTTIGVYVAMPSDWRPERTLGASFAEIHGPVPRFAKTAEQAKSMVSSMVDRGPYVRFVWTVCADDDLDHHPERGRRVSWSEATRGWLRVERQVTVPFPEADASLFLIRTYLYPFSSLSAVERHTLREAIASMPADVAKYKGLDGEPSEIARGFLVE